MNKTIALLFLLSVSISLLGQTQSNFGTAGVLGPGVSVSTDIPTFNGTSGSVLQDPGNCTLTSTILQCVSAGIIRLSTDTGLSRDSAGVWDVGNGTQGDKSGTVNLTTLGVQSAGTVVWNSDLVLSRSAAAALQFGAANSATPVSQTIQAQGSRGGTDTNVAGANLTIQPGTGTGTGAATQLNLNRALVGSTGTTAQSQANALTVCESKTLSTTSATAQILANIALASNSAGGARGSITVTCTDGTNFDSETQDWDVSYVNKAGALTIGTPVITASTAANNSGSCTIGMTAVAGTNQIQIKVTPVFTTIVPTGVTGFIDIHNHGTGAVACQ